MRHAQGARRFALAVLVFAVGCDSFALPGLLPDITAALRLSPAQGGGFVAAYALTIGLAGPALCRLAGATPRRAVLLLASVGLAVGTGMGALAAHWSELLAARLLVASSAALALPMASARAAETVAPAERGRAVAQVYLGMTSALVVGVPAMAWLTEYAGWRSAMPVPALVALLAFLLMHCFDRDASSGDDPSHAPEAAAPPSRIRGTLLVTGLGIAGSFCVYTYLGTIVASVDDALSARLPMLLMLFGIAGLAGNVLAARATSDNLRTRAIGLCLALKSFAFCLIGATLAWPTAGSSPQLILAVVLYGLAGWAFPPLQQARLAALAPARLPQALALNSAVLYGGMAAGALLGGQAIGHIDPAATAWLGAALEGCALVVLAAIHRTPPESLASVSAS